jgi:integrase
MLWQYKYRAEGKPKCASFGPYPSVSIAEARRKHQAAWLEVKAGIDPQAQKQAAKIKAARSEPFGSVADRWLATRTGKSNKISARDLRSVRYLKSGYRKAKGFGEVPVDQVRLPHLMPLLETFNAPTRIRVQSSARKIMNFAKANSLIEQSPFSDIDPDVFAKHREKPRPAITDPIKFGTLMRKIELYEGRGDNLTGYVLELLALTFVRPGTVQNARWSHFDLNAGLWVIPFVELKMHTQREEDQTSTDDFVVPLSLQALGLA